MFRVPWNTCLRLLACPGLYQEIVDAHNIEIPCRRLFNPPGNDFVGQANWTVVDTAWWLAGNGVQPATADAIALFTQDRIRSRLVCGGSEGDFPADAVWVLRWLVNHQSTPLPMDEDNWWAPAWAANNSAVARQPNRVVLPPRTQVHLLKGRMTEEEVSAVMQEFNINNFVFQGGPVPVQMVMMVPEDGVSEEAAPQGEVTANQDEQPKGDVNMAEA